MSVLFVPDGLDGERIDVACARMTGMSRARVVEVMNEGNLLVNGQVVTKPSTRVSAGDLVDVDTGQLTREVQITPQEVAGLSVVYDDADIIVVDKPVGVAAHPTLGWDGPSVLEHLMAAGFSITTSGAAERQGIVQRLDVGTSGLMVVAKSEYAYSVLKQAFRDREVHKIYHALVQGHPDPFTGTIDAPIARHPGSEWKMAVVEGGRRSITHYETLNAFLNTTLLQIHLETGRTHQIRVHMSAIKHPCVGDPLYGSDPVLAEKLGLERQWLHAVELGFIHPGTGEYVTFTSEYPDDLQRALQMVEDDFYA